MKYEEVAQVEKSEITKYHVWEVVDLLHYVEFLPRGFKLDCMLISSLDPDVADVVRLRYGRLSMHTKTKFYMD